jgi:hypothetical protein
VADGKPDDDASGDSHDDHRPNADSWTMEAVCRRFAGLPAD